MERDISLKAHSDVKKELCDIVRQKKVPHAQLFYNPNGVSPLTLVLAHVAYMHCINTQGDDICGLCTACIKTSRYVHPDVHFLFPIGTTDKIKGKEVDKITFLPLWRSFLAAQAYGNLEDWCAFIGSTTARMQIGKDQVQSLRGILSEKSFESDIKTVVVWLPETLNRVTANKMLKMVEEPVPGTYFFFISLAAHNILSTLRSRMWPTAIPPLDDQIMIAHFAKQYPARSQASISQVVGMAQGDLRLAEKMMADEELAYFEEFIDWLRQIYQQGYKRLVEIAEKFHTYAAHAQKNWIKYGLQLLRMVMTMPFQMAHIGHISPEELDFCTKFGRTISRNKIALLIQDLGALYGVLMRHANPKLAFIECSISATHILQHNG